MIKSKCLSFSRETWIKCWKLNRHPVFSSFWGGAFWFFNSMLYEQWTCTCNVPKSWCPGMELRKIYMTMWFDLYLAYCHEPILRFQALWKKWMTFLRHFDVPWDKNIYFHFFSYSLGNKSSRQFTFIAIKISLFCRFSASFSHKYDITEWHNPAR